MESFKSWPFSDRQKCSIQKVIYFLLFFQFHHQKICVAQDFDILFQRFMH